MTCLDLELCESEVFLKHTYLLNIKLVGCKYEQLVIKYSKGVCYVKEAFYVNIYGENMVSIFWVL